ncbi:MAG: hypothetical protein HY077_11290 [Elusimicrobia bacterium]|nr:hypothetical protein [Elusimicrobiota bacterium]
MREMTTPSMLVFAAAGAAALAVLAVVLLRVMNKRDLAAEPGPAADPGGESLTIKGKTYGLHTLKNVAGPAHWALSLAVGCPHTFSVHREDAFEWLLDHLGVMTKVASGNAHYDEEFEINSKEPDWTAKFFSDEENRRLVQELFGLDCSAVILNKGRIQVVFEERDALEEGADALSELAARLPKA